MKKFYAFLAIFDSVSCKFYNYNKKEITLVDELKHPENKLRDIEITSDKPGRYHVNGGAHGTFSQESDPKEIHIDNFAREIAEKLSNHYNHNDFERLVLVAAPHMNGLVAKHIKPQVSALIIHNLKKDLMHLNENDLQNYMNKEIPVL